MGIADKINSLKTEEGLVNLDKYLTKPGLCSCGEAMNYVGLGVYRCENCGNEFKNEYAKVRDFVDKYGTTYSILEIAEHTGVSKRVIDLFIREGRFSKATRQRVCIMCHRPIESGSYCDICSLKRAGEVKERDRRYSGGLSINQDMAGEMRHKKGK